MILTVEGIGCNDQLKKITFDLSRSKSVTEEEAMTFARWLEGWYHELKFDYSDRPIIKADYTFDDLTNVILHEFDFKSWK